MIKRVMMAGAFAGLLMLGGAGASSALPLAKPAVPNADVTKVAHAGPHGMGRGGMGRGGMGGYRGGNFRSRGGNFYGRPHGYGYGYGRGHFRNRGFYGYGGFPYYAYYGAYGYTGGGCGWLRQRAIVTGSPYWWQRYEACRYSY
jgi:hypothetical protein